MADRFQTECPAKLNLFLRVGPPDAGGYHPLETEFQAISLSDTLELIVGGAGFEVDGQDLPSDNTITRTLRLLREVATLPPLGLRLNKRIPSGAGLGGGSSDAAGLIRLVRKLVGNLPEHEALAIAQSIGADVPFFLQGGLARGEGYGDILTPLPDAPTRWFVVAMPGIVCPTPEMYRRLDEARASHAPLAGFENRAENDFHLVAPAECVDLIEVLESKGLSRVGMTGSGAAVFGEAKDEATATQIAESLAGWQAWPVRTLSRLESLSVHSPK